MSLRTRTILVFCTLGTILIGSTYLYLNFFIKKSFETEVFNNLNVVAETNERAYRAFVGGLKMRTLDWSSDSQIRDLGEDILNTGLSSRDRERSIKIFEDYTLNKKMSIDSSILGAEIINNQGIVVASTISPHKESGNRGYEDEAHYFNQAINSSFGEVFVSDIIFNDTEFQKPVLHVMVRLFSEKRSEGGVPVALPGVLLLQFAPFDQFLSLMQDEITPREDPSAVTPEYLNRLGAVKNYLATTNGKIVAGATYALGDVIPKSLLERCARSGESGFLKYVDVQGKTVFGASACVPHEQLVFLTEIPEKVAYATFDDFLRFSVLLGIGGTGLTIIILYVGFQRVSSRIRIMSRLAEKITAGDFSARFPKIGTDEITFFTDTFNKTLDAVERSRLDVENLNQKLKKDLVDREHDTLEHEDQKRFADQTRRATLNLLEDTWKTKEKLESESRRLEAVLGSMGSGLVLIDREHRIQLVNSKTERYFGIPSQKLLGQDLRTVLALVSPQGNPVLSADWPTEKVFMTGTAVVTTLDDRLSITTSRRTVPLPVVISVAPFKGVGDASGPRGAVVVIRDATEELALDDVKSGFISVASHQLRTPLTTIRWYSEMLLEEASDNLSKSQQEFLQEINDGVKRLYQTIDLLLSISRVEGGKVKVERRPIDLSTFTSEVVKELEPQIAEKELIFSAVPCAQGVGIVWLDPLVLRQVILNLFSNAIRYTHKRGSIEACWEISDNPRQIVYSIKDTGIGIPADQQSRMFTKFFRADNALAMAPDGTGLGLPLVKELVEAWGGDISFKSDENKGSTFVFTIPLTTETQGVVENITHDTMNGKAPNAQ